MNKAKKVIKTSLCALLAASFAITVVGCGEQEHYDPETVPLVLSTAAPDKVFNPFFSTSTVDANILSMTQVGLVSTDANGNIICGENEPSVALDYSIRETKEGATTYTTYQFVIKNGVKFSDGVDLTINDVLFNLYVYLDPVYTGSATLYSTKIVGLDAYRFQTNEEIDDDYIAAQEALYQSEGEARVSALIDYVYVMSGKPEGHSIVGWSDEKIELAKQDFEYVKTTFRAELETDYNNISSTLSSYTESNGFTATWQVFLMNDAVGVDFYKYNNDGTIYKDPETKNNMFDPESQQYQDYLSDLEETLADKGIDKNSEGYEEAVKEWAIENAYICYIGSTIEKTNAQYFEMIVKYWGTATTVLNQFVAEAKSEHLAESAGTVKSISGITTAKGSAFQSSSESNKSSYSDDYDLLQVKITGVDPKAIYNFGFSVAPLHYYSGTYQGVDYVATFNPDEGKFGVKMGDTDFMTAVLKDPDKNGFPVGAGVYQATSANGGDSTAENKLTLSDFMSNNVIYFKRNEYFTTLGSGIDNAKIRLLRYKVIDSDQIINSLNTGDIMFGEPDATQENLDALGSNITGKTVTTNGYGYVGINAHYVTNINIRRAIIKALDTSYIINDYYKGGFAEIIYRSMSKYSWAYPETATTYVSKGSVEGGVGDATSYKYDPSGEDIQTLIDKAAAEDKYTLNPSTGVYQNASGSSYSYTFTIAGGSTQHPAYKMFLNAADILNNKCRGISIKVVTSQNALSDLTTGKLQVWAAAWTAAIDPDMYQVYHKDSTASSILNWGFDYIKANKATYKDEWNVITKLSTVIEQARATNTESLRKSFYSTALDYVMELAVEFPTYQRKDLFAFNSKTLKESSMQTGNKLTPYYGPLSRIWEVEYN